MTDNITCFVISTFMRSKRNQSYTHYFGPAPNKSLICIQQSLVGDIFIVLLSYFLLWPYIFFAKNHGTRFLTALYSAVYCTLHTVII
jgi:hypothetical protein